MKDVIREGHQHDVGANDSRHHDGVRDSQCPHQRLLPQIREAFSHVGVNCEGKSGLRDLRHLSALQRFGCGFRCRIELARIFLTVARGNVSAPYTVQAIGGNKIRGAINRQDARDHCGDDRLLRVAVAGSRARTWCRHAIEHRVPPQLARYSYLSSVR